MSYYDTEYYPIIEWEHDDIIIGNKFDRLMNAIEMVKLERNQIHRDIETKIYVENGSFEDMEYLYTEAEDQMAEKSAGLLSKIIAWIRKFIKNIKDKILSLFGKGGDDNTEVKVPKEQLGMIDKIISHFNELRAAFTKIISGDVRGGLADLKDAAGFEFTVAAVGAAFIVIRKSNLKNKFESINKINEIIDNAVVKVNDWIKSKFGKNPITDIFSSGLNFIKKNLLTPISNAVNAVGRWLSGDTDGEGKKHLSNDQKEDLHNRLGDLKKTKESELNRDKFKDYKNNSGDDRGRGSGNKVVNALKVFNSVKSKLSESQIKAFNDLDGNETAQRKYMENLRKSGVYECVGFWFDDDICYYD